MRRRFSIAVFGGLLATVFGLGALAEPLSPRQARKMLFKGESFRADLVGAEALDAATRLQVEALAGALKNRDVAAQFSAYGYYGAIAVVPDRPLSENTMAVVTKLHNPTAAMAASQRVCNAARPQGATACVTAVLILPKRFKSQAFTLSQDATETFRDNWRKDRGPKFLAFSPGTPAWAVAKGLGADQAALSRCNDLASETGARDCVIGISED